MKTKLDHNGDTLIQSSCSVCKKCWINLTTGKCIYAGPYSGYTREEDKGRPEAPKQ